MCIRDRNPGGQVWASKQITSINITALYPSLQAVCGMGSSVIAIQEHAVSAGGLQAARGAI
eukprot:8602925-Alexandrium_andersonii.AAC.1